MNAKNPVQRIQELMIEINGAIGDTGDDGLTYEAFAEVLSQNSGDIEIMLNSGGGVVNDGIRIYNALMEHDGEVTIYVNGIAASIASVIAMAADKLVMYNNAQLMIHKAWTVAMGNSDDFRQIGEVLDQLDGNIADVYAERTGLQRNQILAMMGDETYMSAEKAVELGFADEIKVMKKDRHSAKNETEPGAFPGMSWTAALAKASVVRNLERK